MCGSGCHDAQRLLVIWSQVPSQNAAQVSPVCARPSTCSCAGKAGRWCAHGLQPLAAMLFSALLGVAL
jgi:hypothetical protein